MARIDSRNAEKGGLCFQNPDRKLEAMRCIHTVQARLRASINGQGSIKLEDIATEIEPVVSDRRCDSLPGRNMRQPWPSCIRPRHARRQLENMHGLNPPTKVVLESRISPSFLVQKLRFWIKTIQTELVVFMDDLPS